MQTGWNIIRDFMEVLSRVGRRNAIYRGQANSSWGLVPSIYRPGKLGISDIHHLADWKKRASRFASPLPRDNVEWLVLAQHYGLATALLDWTTSPLVALYFACDDDTQGGEQGTVWLTMQGNFIEPKDTLMVDVFSEGETRRKPFLINAIGRNARSTAQDSLLSLHTESDYQSLDAEMIFNVAPNDKTPTLVALEKLGLSGERLHFDITRLVSRFQTELAGKALVEDSQWQKNPSKKQ